MRKVCSKLTDVPQVVQLSSISFSFQDLHIFDAWKIPLIKVSYIADNCQLILACLLLNVHSGMQEPEGMCTPII